MIEKIDIEYFINPAVFKNESGDEVVMAPSPPTPKVYIGKINDLVDEVNDLCVAVGAIVVALGLNHVDITQKPSSEEKTND